MSRSYRKYIRKFTCTGSNTEYYKARRREIKNAHRMQLRNLLANYNPEDIDDKWIEPCIPTEDQWMEPTDGHSPLNKSIFRKECKEFPSSSTTSYYDKEINRYLKPKIRRKHG